MKTDDERLDELIDKLCVATTNATEDAHLDDACRVAKQAILAHFQAKELDPYSFVEPCEPECSPERHAYHQGQWDMAGRIQTQLQQLKNGES